MSANFSRQTVYLPAPIAIGRITAYQVSVNYSLSIPSLNELCLELTTTSQQICQIKCREACVQVPIKPVCGVFPYVTVYGDRNDGMITFKNQCELEKWSCWNSKGVYYLTNFVECDKTICLLFL